MEDAEHPVPATTQTLVMVTVALAAVALLTGAVFMAYRNAKDRSGTVVLPGGVTYLGEKPIATTPVPLPTAPSVFTAGPTVAWKEFRGRIYPYRFSVPETLPLVVFPNDNSDAVGVEWGGIKPQGNILMNVTDITKEPSLKPYIAKTRMELITNWWKQFPGLSGVATVSAFTNSAGTRGYKAVFVNKSGETPNLDVFFDVPKKPSLIVRFGSGIIDRTLFEKITDSFSWVESTISGARR